MTDVTYLTKEGYQKLLDELKQLKLVDRVEITKLIAEAREKGDLSENSEYDAARDAQGMLEMRISKLEEIIANSRILESSAPADDSKAYILSTVVTHNHTTNKKVEYILVSENEADHKSGKISVKSPIGRALLGKSAGDIIEVEVPAGIIKIEILEILRR